MTPLYVLTRTRGPDPRYDVIWARSTLRIYPDGRVLRQAQVKKPNREGVVAVQRTRWLPMRWIRQATPEATKLAAMALLGYKELEVK